MTSSSSDDEATRSCEPVQQRSKLASRSSRHCVTAFTEQGCTNSVTAVEANKGREMEAKASTVARFSRRLRGMRLSSTAKAGDIPHSTVLHITELQNTKYETDHHRLEPISPKQQDVGEALSLAAASAERDRRRASRENSDKITPARTEPRHTERVAATSNFTRSVTSERVIRWRQNSANRKKEVEKLKEQRVKKRQEDLDVTRSSSNSSAGEHRMKKWRQDSSNRVQEVERQKQTRKKQRQNEAKQVSSLSEPSTTSVRVAKWRKNSENRRKEIEREKKLREKNRESNIDASKISTITSAGEHDMKRNNRNRVDQAEYQAQTLQKQRTCEGKSVSNLTERSTPTDRVTRWRRKSENRKKEINREKQRRLNKRQQALDAMGRSSSSSTEEHRMNRWRQNSRNRAKEVERLAIQRQEILLKDPELTSCNGYYNTTVVDRKRVWRNVTSNRLRENTLQSNRRVTQALGNYQEARLRFLSTIKEGPSFICTCCGSLWFRKSVVQFRNDLLQAQYGKIFLKQIDRRPNKTTSICKTCHGDVKQGIVPKLALSNGLEFPEIPLFLKQLTELEQRLCSLRLPFMQIRPLGVDRQLGLKGNVVNVMNNINDFPAKILPRPFSDMGTIQVRLQRRVLSNHPYMDETIRPGLVQKAVEYLSTTPLYEKEVLVCQHRSSGTLPL